MIFQNLVMILPRFSTLKDHNSDSDLIAEKIKHITYLGCAPARKEGSRTENWKFQEE